jgi:hypothetical protein
VFRLGRPLRQAVLARKDGGRERISARDPTSPRTGADQLERLHPCPARRSTIGGLYDHRPVAPRSANPSAFVWSRIYPTNRPPPEPRRRPRGPAQPSPAAATPCERPVCKQTVGPDPSALPRDGDALSMAAVLNADHSAARKIDKRLILLRSISRIPRIQALQSPYLPPPRFALLPRRGKTDHRLPPSGADDLAQRGQVGACGVGRFRSEGAKSPARHFCILSPPAAL